VWDDEANTVTYRRVEYSVRTTIEKIHQIPVDRFLGDRLLDGK